MADNKKIKKVIQEVVDLVNAGSPDYEKIQDVRQPLTNMLKEDGVDINPMVLEQLRKANRFMAGNINDIKKAQGGVKKNAEVMAQCIDLIK